MYAGGGGRGGVGWDVRQRTFKTPDEVADVLEAVSLYKAALRLDRQAVLGFVAGVFVAFGGLFAFTVVGGWPDGPVGIQKLLFGMCFEVALIFIMLMGSDLFTGDTMSMTIGVLVRAVTFKDWARVLTVSYFSNFAGAVFGAAFFGYFTQVFAHGSMNEYVIAVTMYKVGLPPASAFLRAIACNWLVCVGVFMATAAESVEGKILAAFVPITTFAAIGFEHCVANMFYVPLGLMYGAPTDFGTFIYRNLILVTLGNMIGGILFMALPIWHVFLHNRRKPLLPKSS